MQTAKANKINKLNGFTLVELAIVVTIVGLLVGGVLQGQEMIQQANVTSTISQIRAVTTANRTFFDVYKALPGDMSDATTRITGCNPGNSCTNGDDNSLIGVTIDQPWQNIGGAIASENTQFWKHLALAKLIKGLDPSASVPKWDATHPRTAIDGGLHVGSTFASTNPAIPGSIGEYAPLLGNIMVLRMNISGNYGFNAISPMDASIIDRKMDDGVAWGGRIFAISNNGTTGCGVRNDAGTGVMGYAETKTTKTCDLMMKFE